VLVVAGTEWSSPDVTKIHGRVGVLCGLAALLMAVACEVDPNPICSDGVLAEGEECDDGNLEDGDGCSSGCQLEPPPHFCGDGTLDPGEVCDDGNSIGSDGCSSTCQFDDDASTPGDDRVGFLTCTDEDEGVSLTCSRGTGCCSEPTACRPNEFDCLSPFSFQACDGPEDCHEGEQCWEQNQYIGCTARPDWPFRDVLCHTDADCLLPGLNPCLAGRCYGDAWQIPGYQPACGDGVVDDGGGGVSTPELCDDGNTEDGDGCSSVCVPGLSEDDPNTPGDERHGVVECLGPPEGTECGPGSACCGLENQTGFQCDDGTNEELTCYSYDKCDGPEDCGYPSQCVIDYRSSYCTSNATHPDTRVRCHTDLDCTRPSVNPCIDGTCLAIAPDPVCSDGVVDAAEGCDDGNLVDGDGCSARCQPEDPESLCGNGAIDPEEACDDGNTSAGDGCGSYCQLDDDWSTPGDDRAGFLTCASVSAGVSLTCRPDMGCCDSGTECQPDPSYCQSPFFFKDCDGPEDCPTGMQCWAQSKYTGCDAHPEQTYGGVRCHTDADCFMSAVNPCVEGFCAGEPSDLPGYVPGCGSGSLDPGELCDDGNTEDGDGCNAACSGG
jgi:cysteine-rich repeat protein